MEFGATKARGSRNVSSTPSSSKSHSLSSLRTVKGQDDYDEEIPSFEPLDPPPFHRRAVLQYYSKVEGDLKKWCVSGQSRELLEDTIASWTKLFPYVENLLQAAEIMLELQTEYFLNKEVDNRVWKYGMYAFIKIFRNGSSDEEEEPSHAEYHQLLSAGRQHFEKLIKVLIPKRLNVCLDPVFDRVRLLRTAASSEPTPTDHMIYRTFIATGDLCRYRYLTTKRSRDLNMAKSLYTGARYCDSVKCRAYNQLALISRINGDLVGIIYNFIRAAHGPVPADGARQQLLIFFGDVARHYSKRKTLFWYTRTKVADFVYKSEWRMRYNIWIRPGGEMTLPRPSVPPKRQEHLQSLSVAEVYSRFCLTFANFVGILYTNIGSDTLEQVAKDLLVYFEGLVMVKDYNKFENYVYVVALLVFLIDRMVPNDVDESKHNQVSYMRDQTVELTSEIVVILAEKLLNTVKLLDWTHSTLSSVTAGLFVWCNWILRRPRTLKSIRQSWKTTSNGLPSTLLLTLFRLRGQLEVLRSRAYPTTWPELHDNCDNNQSAPLNNLPEFMCLDGFADVTLPTDLNMFSSFYNNRFPKETAQVWYRLSKINEVLRKLLLGIDNEGCEKALETYQPVETLYIKKFNIMNTLFYGDVSQPRASSTLPKKCPDCNNGRIIVPKPTKVDPPRFTSKLSPQPDVLLSKSPVYRIYTQLGMIGARTEMIIEPKHVVLDTNTVIRYLSWIKILIYVMPAPVIIPSTVLLELRGLCKGASPRAKRKEMSLKQQKQYMMDAMELSTECSTALEFLEANRKYLRVVSTDGQNLKIYKYKSQKIYDSNDDTVLRNDEKILGTCNQIEIQSRAARALDHPLRIYRNTVLLTNDVSLRVRAHAQDVPSCDIQSFTNWMLNGLSK